MFLVVLEEESVYVIFDNEEMNVIYVNKWKFEFFKLYWYRRKGE